MLQPDGMGDKGVLQSIGPSLGKEQSVTEKAPLVAVQRMTGIIYNVQ